MLLHFQHEKKAFTTAPVLMHWIPGSPLIIKTDALDYALTAILSTVVLEPGQDFGVKV